MRIPRLSRHAAVFALAAVALGCRGKTSVTQIWQAEVPRSSTRSVVVFASRVDEANRRAIEDGFVAELAERGVSAKQSYVLFPGALPDREQARASVRAQGHDGILGVALKDVREQVSYVPGSTPGTFWNSQYYGAGLSSWSPGYVMTEEIVSFETTFWDARAEDKLVWAALTRTTNPASGKKFVESLTNAIVPALEKANLIPPTR